MRRSNLFALGACLAALALVSPAFQAAAETAAAQAPEVAPIWPGAAPGTEDWTGPEKDTIGPTDSVPVLVTNVTVPTLTVFRPDPSKASGAAVIVAPGGGFVALAFNSEGVLVAKWLAQHGVTAFVLKYRVQFTPGAGPRPEPAAGAPAGAGGGRDDFDRRNQIHEANAQIAMADGLQAMRYVRTNAAKYHINPDKVGFMGFSAGAITTMRVVLNSTPAERPNFAAPIYGAMQADKSPPKDGPPVFIAAAQDDPQVPIRKSVEIFSAWKSAGLPVELHIYESGGHGFGMLKKNKASDTWPDAFEVWLRGHGWITASAP
jgi:acetyl esterase/lipase